MDPKGSTVLVLFRSLQKDEHLSMPHPKEPSISHFAHRPFFTKERSGVPYHILEMGGLACLQLVGHYVAWFAWLVGSARARTRSTRYHRYQACYC